MKNEDIKLTKKTPHVWRNFQRGLLRSPHCKGCTMDCIVLYDSHHDQYFSCTCGLVIREQEHYKV